MVSRSKTPKVSIILPSYNHAQYLPYAIESILSQTYRDFELIIVDDGSSDGSLQIAEDYADRHSQIRVLTHTDHRNLGISETVNFAYQQCRGEYWSGLPSDDILTPGKIERQVAFLDAYPEVGWVYCFAKLVDETGQPLADAKPFGEDMTGDAHPLRRLIQKNVVPGMTSLMRRSCTDKVGLHDAKIKYSDWEFWLRMTAQCKVAFLPEPLVFFRYHGYNSSKAPAHENMRRALEVMFSFREKAEKLGLRKADPRTFALIDLQKTFYFFCVGELNDAALSLQSVFFIDPTIGGDTKFFASWLRARIFELTYTFPANSPEREFVSWVNANLPSSVSKSVAQQTAAAKMAERALNVKEKDVRESRRLALSCVRKDPSWLQDGALRYVLVETVLGQDVTKKLHDLRLSFTRNSPGSS